MSEGSPEQSVELCSACGQPYTAHAVDCPHLLAVKEEHQTWVDQAEGMTDQVREEVKQKGPETMLKEQMQNIAESQSHQVPVSEKNIKESEVWSFEKVSQEINQLNQLVEWARETLDEYKDKPGVDINVVRVDFYYSINSVYSAVQLWDKLRALKEHSMPISNESFINMREVVEGAQGKIEAFLNKYEVK